MVKTTTQIFAKESKKPVIVALVGLFFAWLLHCAFLAVLFGVFFVCVLYFYRNTERIARNIENDCILAPLDGIIKNIENKDDGIYLEIYKPICFCGLLRMPFAKLGGYSRAVELEHIKGLKNADAIIGERIKIAFDCMENTGLQAELTLYPKNFSQISLYFTESKFRLAERFGFFLVGRAVLKIPQTAQLKIGMYDRIFGGETLLAVDKRVCDEN